MLRFLVDEYSNRMVFWKTGITGIKVRSLLVSSIIHYLYMLFALMSRMRGFLVVQCSRLDAWHPWCFPVRHCFGCSTR